MQLDQLREAIALAGGPAVITGGPGSGKTELCRALAEGVANSRFTALILGPVVSDEDLLSKILRDFGVMSKDEFLVGRRVGVTKQALTDALQRFLRGLPAIKATAVLIVDDAERLPEEAVAAIASLAELEAARQPLIQPVLVGGPTLLDVLRAPQGSPLDQGVCFRGQLDPVEIVEPERTSWLQQQVPPAAAVIVVVLASALAVGVTTVVYQRLGF